MKKTFGIVMLLFFVSLFGFSSFASDTYTTNSAITSKSASTADETDSSGIIIDGQVEKVTIDQAEKWAERKGFEVVHLLQKVVQPFAIIIFILSAFMSLAGSFGNSQLVGRGIFGMFIAVIMYAVVLYAPEIMDSVLGWLTT
jgi:lipopolysaccharide export LptBFGC system permease protein LptF